MTFLHHFHPDVVWYDEATAPASAERQLVSTVHTAFPLGTNWVMLNILEHTAHHIVPQIPLYHLARRSERPAAIVLTPAAYEALLAKSTEAKPAGTALDWLLVAPKTGQRAAAKSLQRRLRRAALLAILPWRIVRLCSQSLRAPCSRSSGRCIGQKMSAANSRHTSLTRRRQEMSFEILAACEKCGGSEQAKGKSGGVRVVYFTRTQEGEVMLVTMFAKGDMENIPVAQLKEIRRALEI